MEIRIGSTKGTGLDGWPTDVYVLKDGKGEVLNLGWWYTWEEAEAARKRVAGEAGVDPDAT